MQGTTEVVRVDIPAGAPDGLSIKVSGQADESPDWETGDLVFKVITEPHLRYERQGSNLYTVETISLNEVKLVSLCFFRFVHDNKNQTRPYFISVFILRSLNHLSFFGIFEHLS